MNNTVKIENDILYKRQSNELIAYVDGSYDKNTHEYAFGCVLLEGESIVKTLYGKDNKPDLVEMRNVAGEIWGSQKAIEFALINRYKQLTIYYDYEGIEKWANDEWKAHKLGTMKYKQFVQASRHYLDINFVKVAAHTGDTYNEMADKLAKKALR